MKIILFCALIFCLGTAFADVTIQPHYSSEENKTVAFPHKKSLVLSCLITADETVAPANIGIEWKFNDVRIEEVKDFENHYTKSNKGLNYSLTVSGEDNGQVGNWSCHATVGGLEQDAAYIRVVSLTAVKIKTENINVVEEEKLRIECSVIGSPFPDLFWIIETSNYNGTDFDDGRVKIDDYKDDNGNVVENGVLIIEKVNKGDRGLYYCNGTNKFWNNNTEVSHSMIRVKDKYAALWPFLGICAEVIVLCAVIIIYEKKRNKTELEESDTDQSPDQKNTPDHGKESNLRQRQ